MTAFEGIVKWTLRNNKAEILQSGEKSVNVPALTAQNVLTIDLSDELKTVPTLVKNISNIPLWKTARC